MRVDHFDCRSGASYRYIHTSDGQEHGERRGVAVGRGQEVELVLAGGDYRPTRPPPYRHVVAHVPHRRSMTVSGGRSLYPPLRDADITRGDMEQATLAGLRIGEVARRTGVSVPTIRAWENRYGLVRPDRTSGGQRLYSEQDIARINGIRQRVEQGWLVSAAVSQLKREEATGAVDGAPSPRPPASTPLPAAVERTGALGAIDPGVLHLAYRTLRQMLAAQEPWQVRDALVDLVSQLGGRVGPVVERDDDAVPLDLSFGEGPPLLPRASGDLLVRLRLETVLPGLVEDGRELVAGMVRASRSAGDA